MIHYYRIVLLSFHAWKERKREREKSQKKKNKKKKKNKHFIWEKREKTIVKWKKKWQKTQIDKIRVASQKLVANVRAIVAKLATTENWSEYLFKQKMLKKDKPMLSVADIIQSQGKVWDRPFSGKLNITHIRKCCVMKLTKKKKK